MFVPILDEEPELAEGLSDAERDAARFRLRARVIVATGPQWQPPPLDYEHAFGFLILDGLMGRRLQVGPAVATELLSPGDVLRPWEEYGPEEANLPAAGWRAFTPTRLALLDGRLTALIGRQPQLLLNFTRRLLRRVRSADYLMTISHLPRVEDRLMAVLWHIASSSGRVTLDGTSIPFRLTHEVLGEVVGARRPSVTAAITTLTQQGRLGRGADGRYVLIGPPPESAGMPVEDGGALALGPWQ